MKGKSVRYTKQEDDIIASCVRIKPYNLQMAFETAAKLIQRKVRSVEGRYYHNIKYTHKMFYIEVVHQDSKNSPYIMVNNTIVWNVKNLIR